MKLSIIPVLPLLLIITAISSCSKETTTPHTATLTVVNAMAGAWNILISNSSTNEPIMYNSGRRYNSNNGAYPFKPFLRNEMDYQPIEPALYDLSIPLPLNTMHTLFMTGDLEHRDTFLVKDEPVTFEISDSSVSFRFVNCSRGSAPVSVSLQGASTGSEVASLSYKSITSFKKYKADASVSSYIFEFRDAHTQTLLATCPVYGIDNPGHENAPNLWRRRNFTIVFDGNPGTAQDWPQTAFIVNYN